MSLPTIAGEFTVAADPDLKFAAESGKAVARVRLVANSRKKEGDQWVDDKTLWMSGTAFGTTAENIAESIVRGSQVNVIGRLQTDEWQDKDTGQKRSATALVIDSIGLSLRFDPAKKVEKAQGEKAAANDPWQAAGSDEPPF